MSAEQLYNIDGNSYSLINGSGSFSPSFKRSSPFNGVSMPNGNMFYNGNWFKPYSGLGNQSANNGSGNSQGMYGDPFGTAMSGTQSGTLQPYVNRMTQNASNALYGGLLDYKPQSLIAGDAGGTPVNSTAPQWNLPSSIGGVGQGLNFTGFGNRSWMGGQ